jgi:hypothetical protein
MEKKSVSHTIAVASLTLLAVLTGVVLTAKIIESTSIQRKNVLAKLKKKSIISHS